MKKIQVSYSSALCLLSTIALATATVSNAADYIDYVINGDHTQHDISPFTSGGASYSYSQTSAGRIEVFEATDTSCNRVEHNTDIHYQGGKHTFNGDVKIEAVESTIVVQIFNAPASGPIMFLQAFGSGGGTLKKYSGGTVVASNIMGVWTNVKIVHDLNADTLTVYINGSAQWSGSGGAGGSFDVKYGAYGSHTNPTKVSWRNAQWDDGQFVKILNRNSGKALNVEGASTTAGANVIQWTYSDNSTRNDEWILVNLPGGFCQVQSRNSWMVLNVDGGSTADGAGIIQWPYEADGNFNDEWQIIDTTSGYVRIMNRKSGKALNVDAASLLDGAAIIQWPYTSSNPTNDEWQIVNIP